MEHHNSWFTDLLNKFLGAPVTALMHAVGLHPHEPPHGPIPDHVAMSLLVVLLGITFVMWLRPRLSAERPGATQQVVEWLITNPLQAGIRDCLDQNVGHHGHKFMAMVGSVSLFVLLANLISVIPGLTSPTANPAGPLACALVTFFYFNWQGIRAHGLWGYLKHFMGPSPAIAWLIFPVEIISTTARILSLTVRLWANIFASELIYMIFLGMLIRPTSFALEKLGPLGGIIGIFPALIPIAFIGLHLFVAVVQSFVFTILPSVYLGMATAEEH
jgi:F-type H+-transporting ATPase subunit a